MPKALSTFFIMLAAMLSSACSATGALYSPSPTQLAPGDAGDFAAYLATTRSYLEKNLVPVEGFPREDQIEWNMSFRVAPRESCTGGTTRGILLVHGLSDSPFVFRDFARALAKDCVEVRTVLLQGHGLATERSGQLSLAGQHRQPVSGFCGRRT
jgi:hypothetical protein